LVGLDGREVVGRAVAVLGRQDCMGVCGVREGEVAWREGGLWVYRIEALPPSLILNFGIYFEFGKEVRCII
jgi:hypothetical protein